MDNPDGNLVLDGHHPDCNCLLSQGPQSFTSLSVQIIHGGYVVALD